MIVIIGADIFDRQQHHADDGKYDFIGSGDLVKS
jgi:hypothetical protein